MLMLILMENHFSQCFHNFNTSHVNVNRLNSWQKTLLQTHFNTSHVNVNPILLIAVKVICPHFNTSHVNVNR